MPLAYIYIERPWSGRCLAYYTLLMELRHMNIWTCLYLSGPRPLWFALTGSTYGNKTILQTGSHGEGTILAYKYVQAG
jgi:hypothetical protein